MNTENPKEQAGRLKCPMHLLPPEALRLAALVHQHGSDKYGRFNWRDSGINATTYIGAIMRHLSAWADGEDNDPETGLSHIAHIISGCNIVLDAQSLGMMNDDRSKPPTPEEAADRMSRSVLREVTPGKPIPVARVEAYQRLGEIAKGAREKGMAAMVADLKIPPHLRPLPPVPVGYSRWEYRGEGWRSDLGGVKSHWVQGFWMEPSSNGTTGYPDYHYIEAVK